MERLALGDTEPQGGGEGHGAAADHPDAGKTLNTEPRREAATGGGSNRPRMGMRRLQVSVPCACLGVNVSSSTSVLGPFSFHTVWSFMD